MRRLVVLVTALVAVVGSASATIWQGGTDDKWEEASNWSTAALPGATELVEIYDSGSGNFPRITAPGAVAGTVQIGKFETFGQLTVDAGATLSAAGGGGMFLMADQPTDSALLINNGQIDVAGIAYMHIGTSTMLNNGTFNTTADFITAHFQASADSTITNNGTINVGGAFYQHAGTGRLINNPTGNMTTVGNFLVAHEAGATGSVVNKGTINTGAGFTYAHQGMATLVNEGTWNTGALLLGHLATCNSSFTNTGNLSVDGWLALSVSGNNTFNMEGGSVDCGTLQMSLSGGVGHLDLNGGTITAGSLALADDPNYTIDITEGVLVTGSNFVADVEFLVSQGYITAYGGAGIVVVEYDAGLDQTTVTGVLANFSTWAGTWGVDIGSVSNDYDGDLLDNLSEYALGGDPTNSADRGFVPTFGNDAGTMVYVYPRRTDDQNLAYFLETADNLVLGGSWTEDGYTELGTEVTGGLFDFVSNSIPTSASETFIRLRVQNN